MSEPTSEGRRDFLKRIARGTAYAAPVISTFAAPSAAAAQVSGPPAMMTLCDYFPVLCRWLGGASLEADPAGAVDPAFRPPPNPELPGAPWDRKPPGGG